MCSEGTTQSEGRGLCTPALRAELKFTLTISLTRSLANASHAASSSVA